MAPRKKKRAPAGKVPASKAKTPFPVFSSGDVVFRLDAKREGLEPILGAAYLMTDVAYARLDGSPSRLIEVRLEPKANPGALSLKALAKRFVDELSTQRLRWAIARQNVAVREFIAEQAVLLASGRAEEAGAPAQDDAADALSEEQRAEIEKLIAEVEDEIRTMNEKKSASDPKNIKASWEEKQEAGKTRLGEGGA